MLDASSDLSRSISRSSVVISRLSSATTDGLALMNVDSAWHRSQDK